MRLIGIILCFFGLSSLADTCITPANFIEIDRPISVTNFTIYEDNSPITEEFNDVTLINFWALWCAPCLTELSLLSEIKKMSDQYSVYTIYLGNVPNNKKMLFLDTITNLTAFYTPDTHILKQFNAQGLPLTLIKAKDRSFAHYGIIKQDASQLSHWLDCLAINE